MTGVSAFCRPHFTIQYGSAPGGTRSIQTYTTTHTQLLDVWLWGWFVKYGGHTKVGHAAKQVLNIWKII